MSESRVVDTNVLIVASAADVASPFQSHATPIEESVLRQQVLDWLVAFDQNPDHHAVLDFTWLICAEYQNKLTEQDYGWLALMAKYDRNEVTWVRLEADADGHAILPDTIAPAITDLSDRKMVAAALAAKLPEKLCKLTNACDTDWLDYAAALDEHEIEAEHIIKDWLHRKWETMKGKK